MHLLPKFFNFQFMMVVIIMYTVDQLCEVSSFAKEAHFLGLSFRSTAKALDPLSRREFMFLYEFGTVIGSKTYYVYAS